MSRDDGDYPIYDPSDGQEIPYAPIPDMSPTRISLGGQGVTGVQEATPPRKKKRSQPSKSEFLISSLRTACYRAEQVRVQFAGFVRHYLFRSSSSRAILRRPVSVFPMRRSWKNLFLCRNWLPLLRLLASSRAITVKDQRSAV